MHTTNLNDNQFHQLTTQLMLNIENELDNFDDDIDCEVNNNVMTLTFNDNSKIIINRQTPLHQMWLATPSQGYHFSYVDGKWMCDKTQKTFEEILTETCSQLANTSITFRLSL